MNDLFLGDRVPIDPALSDLFPSDLVLNVPVPNDHGLGDLYPNGIDHLETLADGIFQLKIAVVSLPVTSVLPAMMTNMATSMAKKWKKMAMRKKRKKNDHLIGDYNMSNDHDMIHD